MIYRIILIEEKKKIHKETIVKKYLIFLSRRRGTFFIYVVMNVERIKYDLFTECSTQNKKVRLF